MPDHGVYRVSYMLARNDAVMRASDHNSEDSHAGFAFVASNTALFSQLDRRETLSDRATSRRRYVAKGTPCAFPSHRSIVDLGDAVH